MIHHDLPDAVYEEFFELKRLYVENDLAVPFDPVRKGFTNPLFFDVPHRGELVGRIVVVEPGQIEIIGHKVVDYGRAVGEVAAHCFGRVVVVLQGLPYYVGWIPEGEYRIIEGIYPEQTSIPS